MTIAYTNSGPLDMTYGHVRKEWAGSIAGAPFRCRARLKWVFFWTAATLISLGGSISIVAAAIIIN